MAQLNSAEFYHTRAAQLRASVERYAPELHPIVMEIAANYDTLADNVERIEKSRRAFACAS